MSTNANDLAPTNANNVALGLLCTCKPTNMNLLERLSRRILEFVSVPSRVGNFKLELSVQDFIFFLIFAIHFP